jgi:hypothetical protein
MIRWSYEDDERDNSMNIMNVLVSDFSVTFQGVDTYSPPPWIDEAVQFLQKELGMCFVEGNNDRGTITVIFAEPFDEEKIEQVLETLEMRFRFS